MSGRQIVNSIYIIWPTLHSILQYRVRIVNLFSIRRAGEELLDEAAYI